VALGVVVGGAAGPALLTAGLVNTPAASASLFLDLELVATAAGAQVIFASVPFIGAVLSWVVLADPVELVQLVAMAVVVCGVGLSPRSIHLHQHEHQALV
jgi:drug/metabolite transporter (DMT)-like permease